MLSTKGALPEVLPLVTLKEVTRNGADPPVAVALPHGEPDHVMILSYANGRIVHSMPNLRQDSEHTHPARGSAQGKCSGDLGLLSVLRQQKYDSAECNTGAARALDSWNMIPG